MLLRESSKGERTQALNLLDRALKRRQVAIPRFGSPTIPSGALAELSWRLLATLQPMDIPGLGEVPAALRALSGDRPGNDASARAS